jgi:c-di-GMP-binding flagellar brake protein YcgR
MPEQEEGNESRKFRRFDVDCRVKIVRKQLAKSSTHFGRASNISAGGMMLVTSVQLETGESISLEFNIPHMTQVLQLRAVVRHRFGEYSYGIEFREMTEQTKQSITRMCETLSVL